MFDLLTASPAPVLTNQFNARVDAESIMATLARTTKQTLQANGGVQFASFGGAVYRKAIGEVQLQSGMTIPAGSFFKITPWQDDYARRVVKFLNNEVGNDGSWAVMWLNPTVDGYATEIRFAYQDKDGDVQFVVHSDRTLVDLQSVDDPQTHGSNATKAYEQWREMMEEVGVRPDQTIKAAQGQRPRDPNVQPTI